jgi:hypothetical protein
MNKLQWLALLLGLLLVSAPLIRGAEDEDYDDGDEDDKSESKADAGDVVVITKSNFKDKVGKSKFALVRSSTSFSPCRSLRGL